VSAERISIVVDDATRVSGLLQRPAHAHTCYVFAHGAGAGMAHPFMSAVADGLAERDIATLRYQFAYMERGSKRPDAPPLTHAVVRAAVARAQQLVPDLVLVAGGTSFGGRMTSQAQASAPLPGVRGLVFLGFPLHPAKQPSDTRAAHLVRIDIPMLFVQGTRDELADMNLLQPLVAGLGARATLVALEHADHSLHVPVRSGRTDAQVLAQALDTIAQWCAPLA